MNKVQKVAIKARLKKLAGLKSTGSPSDLALRFEVSERTIKRIVKELRDEGISIKFSPSSGSYILEDNF